jgi:hypothetical protein
MIRAIIQDGEIRALEPLPAEWTDGRQLVVEDAGGAPTDDLEAWYRELVELGPAQYEPGERDRVQAILDDADAQAKTVVRRQMGLD